MHVATQDLLNTTAEPENISPEENADGNERAKMNGHIESEPLIRPLDEIRD
jgi:hypothetical protein